MPDRDQGHFLIDTARGLSEAQILENFPALRAAGLLQAWAYAESHREEIDRAIVQNEAA